MFGLEKSNSKKKSIYKLVNDNVDLYEQDKISKHAVDFYRNLFISKEPNSDSMKEYIASISTPVLDSTLTEELDIEFSIGEIDAVYTKLKNNKSPSWDGLTAEFYKTFWGNIRTILHSCYVESIGNGSLSPSQRIGILITSLNLSLPLNWFT